MAPSDDTEMGEGGGRFPTTHWSLLAEVRGELTPAHRVVLNLMIERYWKPVYCYVRRRGFGNEDAKDLTQEFFSSWLQRDVFGRVDPSRGRFRSFMLACLDRFLSNARRAERAQRRCPEAGLISIHDLAADERGGFEPADTETPEVAFHRVWTAELIGRALGVFERECRVTEKIAHYELFRQRVIEPALEGAQAPSLGELGLAFGLTKREVGNRLVTARRAFQRVLREEICVCASSEEDVASEMRELFETMKAG